MPATPPGRLVPSAFLAQNRGGGWYSEIVSQRVAAVIATAAHRLRLSPSMLTIIGVLIGISSSGALIGLAPRATTGKAAAVIGVAIGLGWQIAYAFDCADGQLARATGRTSPAGARLDILCDVVTQVSVVTALAAVAAAQGPTAPAWLYAIFAGTWMVNLVTSALAGGPNRLSLITSRGTAVRLVKLVRDYGAVVAFCSLVVAVAPHWSLALLIALSVVNGAFLLASVGQAARRALSAPRSEPAEASGQRETTAAFSGDQP